MKNMLSQIKEALFGNPAETHWQRMRKLREALKNQPDMHLRFP